MQRQTNASRNLEVFLKSTFEDENTLLVYSDMINRRDVIVLANFIIRIKSPYNLTF